jgi:ABC-type nitrate/sulfonate/bicarbonate transport system permease component
MRMAEELLTESRDHRRGNDRLLQDLISVIVVVGVALGLWEIAVRWGNVPVYLLPAPSVIAQDLWTNAPRYAGAAFVTLLEALAGLLLGVSVGAGVAILITYWAQLERGVLALAILLKATPIVAIIPLLIIWLGFGPLPKVIVTGLLTFFPILINVHTGLHAVDRAVLALFHSLNADRWELFRHARWPSALPYLFAGLRVVAPLSLVGAVVAEWAGASNGLGRTMWLAYTNFDLPSLFAAVLFSALMGIGLYGLVIIVENRVLFWT